jgi:hypothetical protein
MVRFSCKVTGGFEMLDRHAEQLLALLGKRADEPGIITVEQIPAAIATLREAAARHESGAKGKSRDADGDEADEPVTLAQRAFPLLDMLERARAANEPVLWGV